MSDQGDSINNMAEIDDVAPLGTVPKIIGLCSEHGWWFEMRKQQESCPQSGCLAKVHAYVWRSAYEPDHGPEENGDEVAASDGDSGAEHAD